MTPEDRRRIFDAAADVEQAAGAAVFAARQFAEGGGFIPPIGPSVRLRRLVRDLADALLEAM